MNAKTATNTIDMIISRQPRFETQFAEVLHQSAVRLRALCKEYLNSPDETSGDAIFSTFQSAVEELEDYAYHLTNGDQQRSERHRTDVISTHIIMRLVTTVYLTVLMLFIRNITVDHRL